MAMKYKKNTNKITEVKMELINPETMGIKPECIKHIHTTSNILTKKESLINELFEEEKILRIRINKLKKEFKKINAKFGDEEQIKFIEFLTKRNIPYYRNTIDYNGFPQFLVVLKNRVSQLNSLIYFYFIQKNNEAYYLWRDRLNNAGKHVKFIVCEKAEFAIDFILKWLKKQEE